MAEWIILSGAVVAALAGCTWLALAMEEHWRQVYETKAPSRKTALLLRLLGSMGLIGSGVLCFLADRPSMALLVWVMLMAISAVLIALTLAWKAKALRALYPLPRRRT